jgi:hypothetical protein
MQQIAKGVCHVLGIGRKRDFIFTRYDCDEHGEWVAKLPQTAPCGCGDDCRIREHDIRPRRTGPGHPLVVIVCVVHGRYFTLYPVGYVPYGRKRLISEEKDDKETFFSAAFDAADGSERWSEIGNDGRWWSTQWRQILRAGELLGLGGDGRASERAAMHLGISLHVHVEACRQYGQKSFRQRGRAVIKTVQAVIAAGVGLLWRLLRAGYAAGCLGRSFYADLERRLIAVTSF